MLKINNNKYEILFSEIKYVNATYNNRQGYSILVSFDIQLNNIKGYISFYVDFFEVNDFKNIENKKYEEMPTKIDSKITMIEIFDTENFIDFIDSKIRLEFGKINNNRIEMQLDIEDKSIKIKYNGLVDINYE